MFGLGRPILQMGQECGPQLGCAGECTSGREADDAGGDRSDR